MLKSSTISHKARMKKAGETLRFYEDWVDQLRAFLAAMFRNGILTQKADTQNQILYELVTNFRCY